MLLFILLKLVLSEKELVTPSLESGLILPGVTRKSLLELASTWVSIIIVSVCVCVL